MLNYIIDILNYKKMRGVIMESILEQIQKEIDELKADKAKYEEALELSIKCIYDYNRSYLKNKEAIDKYNKQLMENIANCDEKIKTLSTKKRTIKCSNTKISNRIKQLSELKVQAGNLQVELRNLETRIQADIKQNKTKIRSMFKELKSLTDEEEIKAKTTIIESIKDENNRLLDVLKLKRKELKTVQKDINIVKSAKNTMRKAVETCVAIKNEPKFTYITKDDQSYKKEESNNVNTVKLCSTPFTPVKKRKPNFLTRILKSFGVGTGEYEYGEPIFDTSPAYVNGEHVKMGKGFVEKANIDHTKAAEDASNNMGIYYEKDGYTYV